MREKEDLWKGSKVFKALFLDGFVGFKCTKCCVSKLKVMDL